MKRQKAIFEANARVGGTIGAVPEELKKNLGPIIQVSPKQIKFNPKNKDFREDKEGWDGFLEDVRKNGIHDPILLRPDYVLIAGERRTRAALETGIETMEARIYYGDLSDGLERKFIIRDNLQRRQLSFARKDELVLEYYDKELKEDNRGKRGGENLAKKVASELNMPVGTAKRVIAKARKVKAGKPVAPKPKPKKAIRYNDVLTAMRVARAMAKEMDKPNGSEKKSLVTIAVEIRSVIERKPIK